MAPKSTPQPSRLRSSKGSTGLGTLVLGAALCASLLGGCGGGGGGGQKGIVGQETAKPDGSGTFFVDRNNGGTAIRLRLSEMFWARLVDVYDLDANGEPNLQPVFQDFTINENVQSDGLNYDLDINPITQRTRLIIQRERGAADTGTGTFDDLLANATQSMPPIAPKNDDGTATQPISFVTRNSCLALRFDDLLDDSEDAERNLIDTIKVLTGYPPTQPFAPRMIFDPNHGGVIAGEFHSTRILIDMTISESEAGEMLVPQPINSLGLPASQTNNGQPNISVRIPSEIDLGGGQFRILTSLSGAALSTSSNGPVDRKSVTQDIVRAMRAGNREDDNNGFLLDLKTPEIVGGWPVVVDSATSDPLGRPGFDFLLQVSYTTICQTGMEPGDIISLGDRFLRITRPASPDAGGVVATVRVRLISNTGLDNPNFLLGTGLFQSTFDPAQSVPTACWVSFSPFPVNYPAGGVPPNAQVQLRFSEPMDPTTILPFDSFKVIRGDSTVPVLATNIVVGTVINSASLREFNFTPLLPFAHDQNDQVYHIELEGVTDLAGNALTNVLPSVDFSIDASAQRVINGGVVMQFNSIDEVEPIGLRDLRGQFFYNLERGVILPRPVAVNSVPADRTNPVPSIMIPFPPGVQTPLSPLGSKLQTVWRYVDLGWQVRDETKYNIDVIGLSWSPIGGQVVSDFYEEFEIAVSHSRRMPDEDLDQNLLPKHGSSGLVGSPNQFTDNILKDPLSPQKVVHPRNLGYTVNPVDRFTAATNTVMMPFPLNRGGGEPVTYTWRDTAALSVGAPSGKGIPLDIEQGAPLNLEGASGSVAAAGKVPTFGLPLLMEYRCFPSDSSIGLNAFDVSLAVNSSARPSFRAYSTGGVNSNGVAVSKNPDLELVPDGGFNPSNNGSRTAFNADNVFYIGQLDYVLRVSRAHTIWIDTIFAASNYLTPIIEPSPEIFPSGTDIVFDFRGADSFADNAGDRPFDAETLDPYGNVVNREVNYFNGVASWTNDIRDIDGARYLQIRISFFNNITSELSPELSAIGVAFFDPSVLPN